MCLTGAFTERGIKGEHGFLAEYYVEEPCWLVKVPPALKEPTTGLTMGESAEKMAQVNAIPREAQDAFAHESHRRAALVGGVLTIESRPGRGTAVFVEVPMDGTGDGSDSHPHR